MLRARLAREEHELLGADALRVHVHDDLEADLVEPRETEVGHLDARALRRGQDDSGLGENRSRTVPRCRRLRRCVSTVERYFDTRADGSTISAP